MKKIIIIILTALTLCSAIVYIIIFKPFNKNKINIIIINLDALRPDHLGCYGYARNTSPHIDDFAINSNLYLNCFSAASWTIPSNFSLLTSLYPPQHNMDSYFSIFDNSIPTIFSILRHQGYAQGVFSNSDLLLINFKKNFGQILDECTQYSNAHLVTEGALRWIKQQRSPFFVWVYYLEPHRPYAPPAPHNNLYKYSKGIQLPIEKGDSEFGGGWDCIPKSIAEINIHDVNYYIAQYDGQIHYADEEVGKLLSGLKKLGLFEESLIIFTSDHGESLGEHHLYFNHIFTLFNEVIRIPLLIKMPGQRQGTKIGEKVGLIDILPTILSETRIGNCRNCEGISLSGKSDKERGLFAFYGKNMHCLIYDNRKIIKYPFSLNNATEYIKKFFPEYGSQYYQFFNIERDQGELIDLKSIDAPQFKNMLLKLSQGVKKMRPMAKNAGFFNLSAGEEERLRSLGYAQ